MTAVQGQRKFQKPFRRRPRFYDSEESSADIEDESEDSDDEVRHRRCPGPHIMAARLPLKSPLHSQFYVLGYAFRRLSMMRTTSNCPALHKHKPAFSCSQKWMRDVTAGKMSKSDKLGQVDHSTINYPPFRRNFYMEASDLSRMSEKEVAEYRSQLDDIKVRGKDVPRPVKNWFQCGLSGRILDVLKKDGFDKPMPIQVRL